MYLMSGMLMSRYGDSSTRSGTLMFIAAHSFSSFAVASSSIDTWTASIESWRAAIA